MGESLRLWRDHRKTSHVQELTWDLHDLTVSRRKQGLKDDERGSLFDREDWAICR